MLSNLKISSKIYLCAAIQLLLIAAVGWAGITQMSKIGAELFDIAEEDIPLMRSLTILTEHQLQQAILFERTLFKGMLAKQGDDNAKIEVVELSNKVSKLTKKIHTEIKEAEVFTKEAIKKLHSQEAVDKYKKVFNTLTEIEKIHDTLAKESAVALTMLTSGQIIQVIEKLYELEKLQDNLDHQLVDILNEVQDFTQAAALKAEKDEQAGLKMIIAILIVAVILAILAPFFIGRSITQPIKQLNERLKEVATGDGDLTISLESSAKDETAEVSHSFNLFIKKLKNIIIHVNQSAEVLSDSSSNAISVLEETTGHIKQQYTETEVVASAVSEMSETIQSVAQSTSDAAIIANKVKQRVNEGQIAAAETHTIVEQLAGEMNQASTVIEALATETDNIGGVLDTIRGIAEQTNLLALNAAIEAARAGDTGRGFAVVADEVRSLAQRTQTSTGDIQKLVEGLQKEAANAVSSMQRGSKSTKMCLAKSTDTSCAFEDASEAVNEISGLNIQIATATEEQSVVSAQIYNSLESIKNIAEKTNEGADNISQANRKIAEKLIDLHSNLNQFQV